MMDEARGKFIYHNRVLARETFRRRRTIRVKGDEELKPKAEENMFVGHSLTVEEEEEVKRSHDKGRPISSSAMCDAKHKNAPSWTTRREWMTLVLLLVTFFRESTIVVDKTRVFHMPINDSAVALHLFKLTRRGANTAEIQQIPTSSRDRGIYCLTWRYYQDQPRTREESDFSNFLQQQKVPKIDLISEDCGVL